MDKKGKIARRLMMTPKVTIVTPSYNQADFIEQTIQSVLKQTYPNVEHIVVDGGSTDGTLDILERYSNQIQWISEPDEGQSDAVNKGWQRAKGEILGWLNSDDCSTVNAVEEAVETFRNRPEVGMIFGECYMMNEAGQVYGKWRAKGFNQESILEHPEWVSSPSMFVRQSVLFEADMLNVELSYAMDYDLFIRLSKITKIVAVPIPMAYFRTHSNSKSQKYSSAHWREILDIHRKYGGKFVSPIWLRYLASKVWPHLPKKLKKVVRENYYRRREISVTGC